MKWQMLDLRHPARCLFGIAAVGWMGYALAAPAVRDQMIHAFNGNPASGPFTKPILGPDGSMWGTSNSRNGVGVIYRLSPEGEFRSYPVRRRKIGMVTYNDLLVGTDGLIYGTGRNGGDNEAGTYYRLDANGEVRLLANFGGEHGYLPGGRLVRASDGYIYGVTSAGGDAGRGFYGGGTIFRINASHQIETVHSFEHRPWNPCFPSGGLVELDGYLYGSTYYCGDHNYGQIYRMNLQTFAVERLHSFDVPGIWGPGGDLLLAADGKLYGGAEGGHPDISSVIFRIDPSGANLEVVHRYTSEENTAAAPGLVQDPSGDILGVTSGDSFRSRGQVFRLNPEVGYQIIHRFPDAAGHPANPGSGLTRGPDGTYYGSSAAGGRNVYYGTLYRLRITAEPQP
jgi:uncharacterized repeat protein (TIGR03803 family)